MAKAKITLELTLDEYKVIENALDNYKGRLIHVSRQTDGSLESYQKTLKEEKVLDSLMREFGI